MVPALAGIMAGTIARIRETTMNDQKLWGVDVIVYATAYIRAGSADEALTIARGLKRSVIEVEGDGDLAVLDLSYDDPDLPDVSLSPAMTVAGPVDGAVPAEAGGV